MAAGLQGAERLVQDGAVGLGLVRVRAVGLEFGDIVAGREGLAAGAAQHQAAQCVVA